MQFQTCYADYSACVVELTELRGWFDRLKQYIGLISDIILNHQNPFL